MTALPDRRRLTVLLSVFAAASLVGYLVVRALANPTMIDMVVYQAEGKAVLMVSSYLPELFGVCDRIAVMSRGILSEARPTAEWTGRSVMELATGS